MKIKPSIKIAGDGSSLYCNTEKMKARMAAIGHNDGLYCETGRSKGVFNINRIEFKDHDGILYGITLFGKNTEYFHYSDSQIVEEVNEKIKPLVQNNYPKLTIKRITWSEHGMQPANGWDFDIITD